MEYCGLGFVEAVKQLAEGVGLSVPDQGRHEKSLEQVAQTLSLGEIMNSALEFYRSELKRSLNAVDYLKQRGEPRAPEAIAAHDTIHFGAMTAEPDWRFVVDGREIRVSSTPRLTSNSADAALQHAEAGGGLTRVLAYQAAAAVKAGRLKIVLAPFEQPVLPIHIVYPTSRLLSAKVRTFIDLVAEVTDWHFG